LETLEKFQLGYCPENRESFVQHAIDKGYDKDLLIKAGLISDRYGKLQAIYHGRVIFPIQNQSGKVIGFGARILKSSDRAPKYINTPENELYQKSRTLYGVYFARTAITQQDECLLVEGYTDVLSLHQAGIANAVASSGTSLTDEQLRLIKRYSKNLTILYDGDAAGVKAALRGLDMAIEEGLNVHVVLLPDNHDPDSYLQSTGAEGFQQYIQKEKKDIILFKLEASLKEAKDDTVKKTALINDIAETLSKINKVEEFSKQQDYIRRCAQLLQIDEAGLIALVNKRIREKIVKKDFQNKISVAEFIRLKIADADFANNGWQKIYHIYFNHLESSLQYPTARDFTYHEEEEIRLNAIEALYFPYELSENWAKEFHIITPGKEQIYLEDVEHTLIYFLLRKIKATYAELLEELRVPSDAQEELIIQTSLYELKKHEKDLLEHLRVVAIR
jgi:DNA primase